jgi:RND family efflux transporter MFP subunit
MRNLKGIDSCVLAAILTSTACQKAPDPPKPAPPVRVAVVETHTAQSNPRYSGTVLPEAQIDLAFRVSGYVEAIHQVKDIDGRLRNIDQGDYIKAGTVLARLRGAEYQARAGLAQSRLAEARSAKATAQAQLEEAIAARNQAARDFERARVLLENTAGTKTEYDAAQAAHERAEAGVAAAKAQVDTSQARIDEAVAQVREAEVVLADTTLRAPFSGVVVARKIELGSLAAPGTPAFLLADVQRVKVAFGVPDVALRSFRVGQKLPVTTEAVPAAFAGRVQSISPSADLASRVFTVEVSIPNPDRTLKIGMIASVQALDTTAGESAPAPMIPLSAVVRAAPGPEGYGVYVLEGRDGKNVAHLRPVRLGDVSGSHIAVQRGVLPGERIVADGGLQLADGEPVRIIQ